MVLNPKVVLGGVSWSFLAIVTFYFFVHVTVGDGQKNCAMKHLHIKMCWAQSGSKKFPSFFYCQSVLLDQEMCQAQSRSKIFLSFFTASQFSGSRNVPSPIWVRNFSMFFFTASQFAGSRNVPSPIWVRNFSMFFLLPASLLDQEMCWAPVQKLVFLSL